MRIGGGTVGGGEALIHNGLVAARDALLQQVGCNVVLKVLRLRHGGPMSHCLRLLPDAVAIQQAAGPQAFHRLKGLWPGRRIHN